MTETREKCGAVRGRGTKFSPNTESQLNVN